MNLRCVELLFVKAAVAMRLNVVKAFRHFFHSLLKYFVRSGACARIF